MRFVPVSLLKDNMVLASPLFDAGYGVLLGEGAVLNKAHIGRINELGYAGVYIDDDETRDLVVRDVITSEMRMEIISSSKEVMTQAERSGPDGTLRINKQRQKQIVLPLIEALIASSRRFADIIDIKPYADYDYYHTANSVVLSLLLGLEVGLSGNKLYDLGMATLLHDIGTAFIPKELLTKPGRLSTEEYEMIKTHTEKGFAYLRDHFDLSIDACMGTLHHHENYDGSGYPNGLRRDRISIYGRIIAITDVFDAMVSRRPYRQFMYPATAMEYLAMNSGTIFDPDLVKSFSRVAAAYPTGCSVELNTGVQCIVAENYPEDTFRPKLRMNPCHSSIPVVLDLKNDPNLAGISIAQTIDG